jgi:predicted dehydrogenase
MIRIALIGAGAHAAGQHLPALADHAARHPGSLQVTAICDRDGARAAAVAGPLGAAAFTDWRRCLEEASPDLALVCLPPALTPTVALAANRLGCAVWTEKPLAESLAGAEELCAQLGPRAFASMNRRFDPAFLRLRARCAGRRMTSFRAIIARQRRVEPEFIAYTAVHIADLAVAWAGPPADAPRLERRGAWARLSWTAGDGCVVDVDIRPTLGVNQEAIEAAGEGWRGAARSAWFDTGEVDWHETGRQPEHERIDPAWPEWRRNGTDAETAAVLAAAAGTGPWDPHPSAVLPATRLCHAALAAG